MHQTIEPTEISFDAYTLCSFLPHLDSSRAIPLVLIGYRRIKIRGSSGSFRKKA